LEVEIVVFGVAEGVFVLHGSRHAVVGLSYGNLIARDGYSEFYAEILLVSLCEGGHGHDGHCYGCEYLFHNGFVFICCFIFYLFTFLPFYFLPFYLFINFSVFLPTLTI